MPEWDEEEEEPQAKDWKKWLVPALPMILAAGFWLIFHNRIGVKQIDFADIIFFGILAAWMLYKLPEQALFRMSPKLVFANGHDTCIGSWETVGNYAVITRGIDAFGIKYGMKSPVYICPADALTKKGRNLVASAWMSMSEPGELPPTCVKYIKDANLQPPFFVGYADIEQYLKLVDVPADKISPDLLDGLAKAEVSYMIDEITQRNKQVNMLQQIADDALGTSEKSIASKKRIYDRLKGEEPLLKKAARWAGGGGKKEEEE